VVHIEPPFIADSEPPEFVEPCEAALDHPSMATELLAGLDAAPGDAWLDMATQAGAPATPVIVGFVCVQLVGSAFWSAALTGDGRHSIEQVLERYAVVDVGPGQQKGERDAVSIRDQMAFGARPASVGRVRTCRGTPFLGRDGGTVHAGPAPIDAVCVPQLAQQLAVQTVPYPGRLPVA
jgi:hypothetical protein